MGWFFNRPQAASAPAERDPSDDRWFSNAGFGPIALSGEFVDEAAALRVPTLTAAVLVIAESVAQLPVVFFRRAPDGTKEVVADHPLRDVLRGAPNRIHTSAEFRLVVQSHLCLYRNAYVEIRPSSVYEIGELVPHHPNSVVCKLVEGRPFYTVTDGFRSRTLSDERIVHFRTAPFEPNGLCGIPLLTTGRDVIGKALALQRYGSTFFKNGSQSGGVFQREGAAFKTPEDEKRWLEAWRKLKTGNRAHGDAILPPGMTYHETTVDNERSQFNETEKETSVQIARLLGVQPHKVGIMDKATFSNIEQQALEFVVDTLTPWLVLWEQRIRADLVLNDPALFVEFNVAGLLRGDTKMRFEAYARARQWGWLSVNEIRALENMNSIGADGDVYLQPMNMQEVGEEVAQLAADCRQLLGDLRAAQTDLNAAGLLADPEPETQSDGDKHAKRRSGLALA